MQPQMQGMPHVARPAHMMSFMDATKSCLQQYVGFSGRASRSEYWFAYLSFMVAVVGMLILTIISAFIIDVLATLMGLLTFGLYIGGFLPLLAVSVRRLHDLGKSGWMMLVMFIPFVGGILLLVWFVSDGEAANNAYGPVPTNTL
ncbi:MAG TPA: DUF805 domain-containing protein [Candidatus Poseidoniales archaeon]|jgi:uncharacterized membrane protein YhaH (DUF805 family)|nr:MAG TPA: DUF805 domain-containing protein [Candidatus Poseidoniales archaeon]HII21833.1 DUF805 domain-containing protein [Candidatus Poseidoniaceae archaeon]